LTNKSRDGGKKSVFGFMTGELNGGPGVFFFAAWGVGRRALNRMSPLLSPSRPSQHQQAGCHLDAVRSGPSHPRRLQLGYGGM
jgi:hypothetical protein